MRVVGNDDVQIVDNGTGDDLVSLRQIDGLHQELIKSVRRFVFQGEYAAGCGLGMVTVDEEDFFAGVGQKSGQIGALSGFPFTTFSGNDRDYSCFMLSLGYNVFHVHTRINLFDMRSNNRLVTNVTI